MTTNEKITPIENDVVTKSIGSLGRWQILICLAIFLSRFTVAWHQLSIVFLAPPMDFTCLDRSLDKCDNNCTSHVFNRSVFTETIISQWDLVCGNSHLFNFAQLVTMSGILLGNVIFGYLSDRFGRKNPLILSVILQFSTGICTAFVSSFTVFLIMRFLTAFATGGSMITCFVLIMEIIGTEWRTTFGILNHLPFNVGHLMLPLISYFVRNWQHFQLAISVPSIILISYYWILPESPRWLLTMGRQEKAIKVMEKAAKANNLPVHDIKKDIQNYAKENNLQGERKGGNILDLVKTPIMRMYTLCIGFNWFVCGLCFFGVAQYVGQLGGNIFVNVALSALTQIPGTLFALWSVQAWGRRYTVIFGNLLAAISCISLGVLNEGHPAIKAGLSSTGLFGLTVVLATVYIYSGELFPTMVRNMGVGTSSMCARIGSMAAPFAAGLAEIQSWLPPLIFGIIPVIGAVLCYKLPETLGCKLPDTVEEAEDIYHKRRGIQNETGLKK